MFVLMVEMLHGFEILNFLRLLFYFLLLFSLHKIQSKELFFFNIISYILTQGLYAYCLLGFIIKCSIQFLKYYYSLYENNNMHMQYVFTFKTTQH